MGLVGILHHGGNARQHAVEHVCALRVGVDRPADDRLLKGGCSRIVAADRLLGRPFADGRVLRVGGGGEPVGHLRGLGFLSVDLFLLHDKQFAVFVSFLSEPDGESFSSRILEHRGGLLIGRNAIDVDLGSAGSELMTMRF